MDPLPRDQLRELLASRGSALEQDARQVKALLLDMCPRNRREVGVLVAAAEEGIPVRLRRSASSPSLDDDIERLSGQLEDDRGLNRDVARWAVQSWAWALGLAPAPDDAVGTSQPSAPAQEPPPMAAASGAGARPAAQGPDRTGPDAGAPRAPARAPAPVRPAGPGRRPGAGVVLVGVAGVAVVAVVVALATQSGGGGGGGGSASATVTLPPETTPPDSGGGSGGGGGGGGGGSPGQETDLTPDRAGASSTADDGQDAGGNQVSYDVANTVDGDTSTTWRTPGKGINERLQFEWDSPVHLVAVGMVPGYDKVDPVDGSDRFAENRRVTRARYIFSDGSTVDQRLEDSREYQSVTVDVDTTSVTVVILGSTANPKRDFVAISEVGFRGWET